MQTFELQHGIKYVFMNFMKDVFITLLKGSMQERKCKLILIQNVID